MIMEKTIQSVLGFDFNLDLIDAYGEPVKTGIKSTVNIKGNVGIKPILVNKKWFTNYNEALLEKIRDYKRLND